MTTLRAGSATDVGQIRSTNQDTSLIVATADLYGVADGMGGHQGGEVASVMAVEITEAEATEPTLESLQQAVRRANRAIFERAGSDRDLHGMGTTLVAVRLVDGPEGEEVAWVNVGDSRVYLLRDDDLVQLSADHSLVEDLLRDGQITEDEAAVHPQRNILTRALGIDLDVVVDGNTVLPFTGDRFLLCSDGLFNEVSTDQMSSVLRRLADPDEVAAELVRLANEGGGRDNITVVVVDVVDDGGRAAAASAAMADDPTTVQSAVPAAVATPVDDDGDPAPSGSGSTDGDQTDEPTTPVEDGDGGETTAADEPAGTDDGPVLAGAKSSLSEADDDYGAEEDDLYSDLNKARTRHITWRVVAFLFTLAVVGAVVVGALWYSTNRTYFVGYQDDEVAIYQGKPGGVLWFDPDLVRSTDLTSDELPPVDREAVAENPEFSSRSNAEIFVSNLASESDDDSTTTSTTTSSTTTSSTTTSTTTAPATTTRPTAPTTTGP